MTETTPRAARQWPAEGEDGKAAPELFAGYSQEERPLIAYSALVGLYHLAFAMFLAAAKGAGRPLPQRVALGDILLVGVATFKMSRLIASVFASHALADFLQLAYGAAVESPHKTTGQS